MWSKSDAEKYMSGTKTFDELESNASQTVEESPSPVENTDSAESVDTDTAPTSKDETPVPQEEKSVEAVEESDNLEKVESDIDSNDQDKELENQNASKGKKKKSYTKDQQIKYSFIKEKQKRKDVENRLAEKQKEIDQLKAELEKYAGLKKEHFKDDEDAYIDYKVEQRLGNERLQMLQQNQEAERQRIMEEEARDNANRRLVECYPDEADREQYNSLITIAENNFESLHPNIGFNKFSDLLLAEEDRTVLKYLQDSDNSPKLIKHFIYKPESVMKIMNMRNPYNKVAELRMLESRMLQHERLSVNKAKLNKPEEKKLKDTGKVIVNGNMNNTIDYSRPWTKKQAEEYIKNRSNN